MRENSEKGQIIDEGDAALIYGEKAALLCARVN